MDQFQRAQRRIVCLWSVFFASLAIATAWVAPAPVLAQEEQAETQEAAPAETPAAPADSADTAAPRQESFLIYCFRASPTFFLIMLVISMFLAATAFSNYQKLQMGKVIPRDLIAQLDGLLNEKNYKEAYEVIRGNTSLFSRALTSGVERLSHGFDRGVDAMVSVAEDGKMDMEHKVSPIATIGSVAPMLGLLGTVIGMILAFQEIAGGGQPKPAVLAENIGLALVTTLEGIVVAVPAIALFAFFRNRISRLIFEVESLGEAYLWRFAGALKKS